MRDLRSHSIKLHFLPIRILLLSEWLLHHVPRPHLPLQQNLHQMHHPLPHLLLLPRILSQLHRTPPLAELHLCHRLSHLRLHSGKLSMPHLPSELPDMPVQHQLQSLQQWLLFAAGRMRLQLPRQLPHRVEQTMLPVQRCMSDLRDLKGQLHLLQDQSFQTPLHLSRKLSFGILFQREELPVRGRAQLENRVFPPPHPHCDNFGFRLGGQVPDPPNQPAYRPHRSPLLNIDGHLGLHRSWTRRTLQVAKHGLHTPDCHGCSGPCLPGSGQHHLLLLDT